MQHLFKINNKIELRDWKKKGGHLGERISYCSFCSPTTSKIRVVDKATVRDIAMDALNGDHRFK